jgi:hypothetical protein
MAVGPAHAAPNREILHMTTMKFALPAFAALLLSGGAASAANLAIFGANNIGSLYSASNTVTYVSDANLSTAGFLSTFDAFIYTRDGSSFGNGLSVAAAANVKAYVTGNVVLFNGDFQDDIGVATTDLLFNQALAYVLTGAGGGYIGEYRGSFAAFATNDDGNNPIGLVNGNAGPSGFGNGGSDGDVMVTAAGLVSSVTAGVPFPYNPGAVEFGSTVTGVNPSRVLASFTNGNPAIIASSIGQISGDVPEPATWAMLIAGFGLVGATARRRRAIVA